MGRTTQPRLIRVDAPQICGAASAGEGNPGGRVAELDSLRGMAAVAVVVFHAYPFWLPFGWAAVDLFFVLSGYLITSIILRSGDTPGFLGKFYVRRGLRTWPIYYLLIALLIALSPVLELPFHWSVLPYALTYTQGVPRFWSGDQGALCAYLGHTWTLAIEEQFYLLWPALVLLVGPRRVSLLALACAAGSVLSRSRGIWLDGLASRSDGLALGGWLATYRLGVRGQAGRPQGTPAATALTTIPALVACLVLGVLGVRHGLGLDGAYGHYPGLTVLAFNLLWLGIIDLVSAHAGRLALWPLRIPSLRRLGELSYGLYLYHLPLLVITLEAWRGLGFSGSLLKVRLLGILLSVPVAALSWRYIERPLIGLKHRYPYRGAADESGPGPTAPTHRLQTSAHRSAFGDTGEEQGNTPKYWGAVQVGGDSSSVRTCSEE